MLDDERSRIQGLYNIYDHEMIIESRFLLHIDNNVNSQLCYTE